MTSHMPHLPQKALVSQATPHNPREGCGLRESKAKFSGGMADSPEYRTFSQHQTEMVLVLADEVDQLTDELFAKGLISGDDVKTVKKPYRGYLY